MQVAYDYPVTFHHSSVIGVARSIEVNIGSKLKRGESSGIAVNGLAVGYINLKTLTLYYKFQLILISFKR